MIFPITPQEKSLFDLIRAAASQLGLPVYAVGGYVRDRLLARASKDIDIVCVGDGIALAEKVASMMSPTPYVAVYSRFGTAMLRFQDLEVEFVGAALAVSLNDADYGTILDSFGGCLDLERKIIQTPLDPDKTFADDPLRMMRAIRFATQLNFTITPETLDSIARNRKRIQIISVERITAEMEKILLSPVPSIGFTLLFDTGLLQLIFPEMAALQGVEIRNQIGHKDNFYHTLEVLDNICRETDNVWLRWAAVLHDIAKPPTKRFDPQLGWTFYGHEALGAAMVPRLFRKLKLPLDHKMKYVQKLVLLHLRPIALTNELVTDSAVRRLLFEAGEDIDDLMTLCKADITSKNEGKVNRYKENYRVLLDKIREVEAKDHLRNWQPPISGEDIMRELKLRPSREVGLIKLAIREAILDGELANDYEEAFRFMMEKAREMKLA
ncbi:MAG: HD domain-containing protein [Saprospiraceae bacterium]|nr:HD domain-containing protein [Saprospiraceae bacterium]